MYTRQFVPGNIILLRINIHKSHFCDNCLCRIFSGNGIFPHTNFHGFGRLDSRINSPASKSLGVGFRLIVYFALKYNVFLLNPPDYKLCMHRYVHMYALISVHFHNDVLHPFTYLVVSAVPLQGHMDQVT